MKWLFKSSDLIQKTFYKVKFPWLHKLEPKRFRYYTQISTPQKIYAFLNSPNLKKIIYLNCKIKLSGMKFLQTIS